MSIIKKAEILIHNKKSKEGEYVIFIDIHTKKNMLAKIWKKVCILILIVACLFNIVLKLIDRVSFNKEALTSAQYMMTQYEYEKDSENVLK